jgi:hypothetical protein
MLTVEEQYSNLKLSEATKGGDQEVVKRSDRDQPIVGCNTHVHASNAGNFSV